MRSNQPFTYNRKINNRDYMLVLILILISGNPLFIYSSDFVYIIYLLLLTGYILITKIHIPISSYPIRWYSIFILLFIAQAITIHSISIPADINFLAKFTIAFFTISICKDKFAWTYTKIMYYICIISLFFFSIELIFQPPLPFFNFDRYYTLGVWNCISRGSFRNSGMFWEPGAFQGFTILPFLFYIDKLRQFWKYQKKIFIILIISIISTSSTTGYIVLGVLAFSIMATSRINIIYKFAVAFVIISLSITTYIKLDFMGEKIEDELSDSQSMQKGQVSWSRTGALLIDIQNIYRHPIVGNGFLLESRYKGLGKLMSGTGNGFTGAMNIFGLPLIILYFIGIYRAWNGVDKPKRFIVIIEIILLLTGEFFLNYPLYWSLIFLRTPFQFYTKKRCIPH